MTPRELNTCVRTAEPGASIVYWVGDLATECEMENDEAIAIREQAMTLHEKGFGALVQRRQAPNVRAYIFQRNTRGWRT